MDAQARFMILADRLKTLSEKNLSSEVSGEIDAVLAEISETRARLLFAL